MLSQNFELRHYNDGSSFCPFALLTTTALGPFFLPQLSLCHFLFSSCSVPIVGPHYLHLCRMVLSMKQWSAKETSTAPGVPPHAGGDRQRRPADASRNEQEMSEHPGWGRTGERGRTWNACRKKTNKSTARIAWRADRGREGGK